MNFKAIYIILLVDGFTSHLQHPRNLRPTYLEEKLCYFRGHHCLLTYPTATMHSIYTAHYYQQEETIVLVLQKSLYVLMCITNNPVKYGSENINLFLKASIHEYFKIDLQM